MSALQSLRVHSRMDSCFSICRVTNDMLIRLFWNTSSTHLFFLCTVFLHIFHTGGSPRSWGREGVREGGREGGCTLSCLRLILKNNCDHFITITKAVSVHYDYSWCHFPRWRYRKCQLHMLELLFGFIMDNITSITTNIMPIYSCYTYSYVTYSCSQYSVMLCARIPARVRACMRVCVRACVRAFHPLYIYCSLQDYITVWVFFSNVYI